MKTLLLDLEQLRVESFEPGLTTPDAPLPAPYGGIQALQNPTDATRCFWCPPH